MDLDAKFGGLFDTPLSEPDFPEPFGDFEEEKTLNLDVVLNPTGIGDYEILYQENNNDFEFVDVKDFPEVKKEKKFKPKISYKVPKPYACEECPYRAKNRGLLKRHMISHSSDKPFRCPICDKALKSNQALVYHVNSHTGKKPYGCQECPARFTTQGEVIRHVK